MPRHSTRSHFFCSLMKCSICARCCRSISCAYPKASQGTAAAQPTLRRGSHRVFNWHKLRPRRQFVECLKSSQVQANYVKDCQLNAEKYVESYLHLNINISVNIFFYCYYKYNILQLQFESESAIDYTLPWSESS